MGVDGAVRLPGAQMTIEFDDRDNLLTRHGVDDFMRGLLALLPESSSLARLLHVATSRAEFREADRFGPGAEWWIAAADRAHGARRAP